MGRRLYLEEDNVIILLGDEQANILHPLIPVFGDAQSKTPAVQGEQLHLSLHPRSKLSDMI